MYTIVVVNPKNLLDLYNANEYLTEDLLWLKPSTFCFSLDHPMTRLNIQHILIVGVIIIEISFLCVSFQINAEVYIK